MRRGPPPQSRACDPQGVAVLGHLEAWHPLLAQLAIRGRGGESRAALDAWGGLATLLKQSEEQGVAYAVASELLARDWRPLLGPEDAAAVRRVQEAAVRHDLVWERGARDGLAVFPGHVRPILLKGGGGRFVIYDEPVARAAVDLDLMVPGGSKASIRSGLETAGWRDEKRSQSTRWHVHAFYRPAPLGTMSLEFHQTLDNPERGAIDYETLAPHCSELEVLGRVCLVPNPAAQLLVGATHALRHGLNVPLKSLVDVHRTMQICLRAGDQRWDGDPREDPVARVGPLLEENPGVAATIGVMLRLSQVLFQTPVPQSWRQALAPPRTTAPLLSLSLDPQVPGYARGPFTRSEHLRRLWFQALLTGSPITMARVGWGWDYP